MSIEVELLQREIQPVLTRAGQIAIRTANDRTDANGFLVAIKGAQKKAHETFDGSVEAAHASWKTALALRASFLDPLDKAEKIVKAMCQQWDGAQERLRLEEQRRLQAIADEAARKERQKAEQEAAKQRAIQEQKEREAADARRKAEEAEGAERKRLLVEAEAAERKAAAASVKVEAKEEQAAAVCAPVITVSGPEKQAGETVRKLWRAKLADKRALVAAGALNDVAASLLAFDQSAADRLAVATKGAIAIPGIEWYTEISMAVRRGGKE